MAKRLTISQLNGYIKQMFQDEMLLHNIEVVGEVSDFSVSGSTTYVTLRENDFILSCVKFSTHEPIQIGTNVIVNGTVGFYEKGGRLNFTIKSIVPLGEGKHFLKLKQLKKQLLDEGIFSKGKQLPFYINKVAIITSASGAVIHDFTKVLNEGNCFCDIKLFNVKVQGDGADKEITNAVLSIDKWAKGYDCLVIMRGGGSVFDLDTFNSEQLARAVAECSLPVISAVGHEVDFTLCDYSAKTRAGTPSIAAEIICSVNKKAQEKFSQLTTRLKLSLNTLLQRDSLRLERAESKIVKNAQLRVAICQNNLLHLAHRMKQRIYSLEQSKKNTIITHSQKLCSNIFSQIESKEEMLNKLSNRLNNSSPMQILKKGYAKVFKSGVSISDVCLLKKDDEIELFMQDGSATARIIKTKKGHLKI